jgi:hypothetical protein
MFSLSKEEEEKRVIMEPKIESAKTGGGKDASKKGENATFDTCKSNHSSFRTK